MIRVKSIGREEAVDYSGCAPDWHTHKYSKEHGLLHPEISLGNNIFLRKNEFPYDGWDEHRLILARWEPVELLADKINLLNDAGYTVIYNSTDRKSAKSIWHGHALK